MPSRAMDYILRRAQITYRRKRWITYRHEVTDYMPSRGAAVSNPSVIRRGRLPAPFNKGAYRVTVTVSLRS